MRPTAAKTRSTAAASGLPTTLWGTFPRFLDGTDQDRVQEVKTVER